jgi:phosphohistidine swiveling domain-containing protein
LSEFHNIASKISKRTLNILVKIVSGDHVALILFNNVPATQENLGGKGYVLGALTKEGFPVPAGAILTSKPSSDEFAEIIKWWENQGQGPLAIRSSAVGEDSDEHSFAGQNKTFLGVKSVEELKDAIEGCFESIHGEASKTYRHFFTQKSSFQAEMNVVIQLMVNPKFSGVYFSKDPRGKTSTWIIELIEGLGEDLVSGRKTPYFITAENRAGITVPGLDTFDFEKVLHLGMKVKSVLKYEVDMEWALDQNLEVQLLQARPVTALRSISNQVKVVEAELQRLKSEYPDDPTWDGQTFAEWTGFPSYLTFSLWKHAFSPKNAFSSSLKTLGYRSFTEKETYSHKDSLLERVFGRAYVNLEKMSELYFGPIPFTMITKPRPHLKFDFKKLNLQTIIFTPVSFFNMIKVGFSLSSRRGEWLKTCSQELVQFSSSRVSSASPDVYTAWDDQLLHKAFCEACWQFSREDLHWPLVLIILTESTMQTITSILKSIKGEVEAAQTIRKWMGQGLQTITSEMNRAFQEACSDPLKRPFFMSKFGHRGPGELDLANPRWLELADTAFYSLSEPTLFTKSELDIVTADIMALNSFKRDIILQEWRLLKAMLELREKWKMELLKPYAQIRYMASEIGRRTGLNKDIHWLRLSEIEKYHLISPMSVTEDLKSKIDRRKMRFEVFKQFSLPEFVTVKEIESIINGENTEDRKYFDGEALSPGLVFGEVVVVENPTLVDPSTWGDQVILVAESTDPGWTPLFARAKGIIVDKGGVLSHCAIVAREMNIPAVSRIRQCHRTLKTGDKVCVDGNNGRISIESR